MKQRIPTLLALIALASPAIAIDVPSVERGKGLFTSTKLGINGRNCAGCHQDGKGLEGVGKYDDAQLGKIINQCITKPLKGKALDPASSDMKSLAMYLKTFEHQQHE